MSLLRHKFTAVYDIWVQDIWVQTFGREDIWAQRHLGARHLGARHFWHFVSCKPKTILVYPNNVKVADVLQENYSFKQKLECLKRAPDQKNALDEAIRIRVDIQNREIAQTWSPQA